jgi:hemerythrin
VAHGYDPHDATILVHALQHWLRSHIANVDRNLRHCVKTTQS